MAFRGCVELSQPEHADLDCITHRLKLRLPLAENEYSVPASPLMPSQAIALLAPYLQSP